MMGWTKHKDAVDLHIQALKRSHTVMQNVLSGKAKLSPKVTEKVWGELITYVKMKRALPHHAAKLDDINMVKVIRTLGKKCDPVTITVIGC